MSQSQREILKLTDVCVSFKTLYHKIQAVKHASFELYRGESLGIVGESGCGKSALVKTILGLNPKQTTEIESGEIYYKGKDLLSMNESGLRKIRGHEIGMIFQDPIASLNPTMKVGLQILESYMLANQNASDADGYEKVISLLNLVGISHPERRFELYPFELSGGMCQRIMIAMSLACSPNILIADEPTTALDVTIQSQILWQLQKIQKQVEMSIIFITHNLSLVAGFCSRIIVMYGGTIVESAPTEEIFNNPKHPYTQKLLASIPNIHQSKKSKLTTIEGHPPSPDDKIQGCMFHPRCPYATLLCKTEEPLLKKIGSTEVACHHASQEPAPKNEMSYVGGGFE